MAGGARLLAALGPFLGGTGHTRGPLVSEPLKQGHFSKQSQAAKQASRARQQSKQSQATSLTMPLRVAAEKAHTFYESGGYFFVCLPYLLCPYKKLDLDIFLVSATPCTLIEQSLYMRIGAGLSEALKKATPDRQ